MYSVDEQRMNNLFLSRCLLSYQHHQQLFLFPRPTFIGNSFRAVVAQMRRFIYPSLCTTFFIRQRAVNATTADLIYRVSRAIWSCMRFKFRYVNRIGGGFNFLY